MRVTKAVAEEALAAGATAASLSATARVAFYPKLAITSRSYNWNCWPVQRIVDVDQETA
jgi:hypothetical protein